MHDITTHDQLLEIQSTLETLLSLVGSKAKFQKMLAESSLPEEVTARLQDGDRKARKQTIEEALADLAAIDVVEVTTAFKPKKATLEKMAAVIGGKNTAIGSSVVIDSVIDSTILGGVIIEHQGKYKDLSLRRKIEKFQ